MSNVVAIATTGTPSYAYTGTPFDVDLDGSGSTTSNPGAVIVEYAWLLAYKPPLSTATMTQPSGTGNPLGRIVGVDLPGTYLAFLRARDSTGAWSDVFLDASDDARVPVCMRTEHEDWSIPAGGQRAWQDLLYRVLMDTDGGLSMSVLVDDITVGYNGSSQLYVKNLGIGTSQLAAQAVTWSKLGSVVAAAQGLTGGAGAALGVDYDSATLGIVSTKLAVLDLGITSAKIAALAVTAAKLGSDVAGSGLTGGNGSALAVNYDNSTIGIVGGKLAIKSSGVGTTQLAATSVTAAKLGSDVVVVNGGLQGGNGSGISAKVDNVTVAIDGSGNLIVKAGGVGTTQLASNAVTAAKIATAAIGDGLQGGGGTAVSAKVDNFTTEINSVTKAIQIKDGGVTLAKLGDGAFFDPGRPATAVVALLAGNFAGGETVGVSLGGTLLDTFTATPGQTISDLQFFFDTLSSAIYQVIVPTQSGRYIDLVVYDDAARYAGDAIAITIGGTANANLVSQNPATQAHSHAKMVQGLSYVVTAFDVTRGKIIIDFYHFSIDVVVVNTNHWNGLAGWSGHQIVIDNAVATTPFQAGDQINIIATGRPA